MTTPTLLTLPTVPLQRVLPLGPAPSTTAACTPKLGRRALRREQVVTLHTPPRRYGPVARLLFVTMDLMYGRRRTLEKFQVLEIVARVPYQIWENAAYRAMSRWHRDSGLARRIRERILETREQQDNEQWHLLILTELVAARGGGRSRLRFRVLPWVLAASWYHVSWLMFVVSPRWSYRLNADFEDHAEREYARFVEEHPEFEMLPHGSAFAVEYGAFPSMADLLRQIGHDERMHKQESEAYCAAGRLTRR
jgi:ubiquinol oxidase